MTPGGDNLPTKGPAINNKKVLGEKKLGRPMPAQPLSVEYDYTVSRRGNIYKSFASLCDCIAADLRTKSAILDGEIVEFCPFTGATHHALTKQQRTLSNLTGAILTNSETESATDSF